MITDNDYAFIPFCGDQKITDTLLIAKGDVMRWLVAPCMDIQPGDLIRLVDKAGAETVVGSLRRCRGEFYTDMVLAVGSVPDSYRQFALEVDGQPITTTFYPDANGYADRLAYTRAIAAHLANQPFIAIDVYRSGFAIYVRIYDGERIRLAGQSVAVGLGKVITPNSNVPVIRVSKTTPITYAASWPYLVNIGASIEAGNIYRLDGVSYTAQQGDTALQVRSGLGLSLDESVPISRLTAAYPLATADAGTGQFANSNNPSLNLQYTGTSGGSDTYLVVVGNDIVPGNVYQIQVTGSADRIVVASGSDNAASITTALVSGGLLSVTAGLVPLALTDAGYRLLSNTNVPGLTLTALTPLPARTLDRWMGFVGLDIVAGNRYELSIDGVLRSYEAKTGDTATIVANSLGQPASNFTIEVPASAVVYARSFRGDAYQKPRHVAPLTLTQTDRPMGGPYVAEVTIPLTVAGVYKLACGSVLSSVRLQAGNAVGADTSVVRWSASTGEDNLICQLRLPVFLSAERPQQTESTYPDLSGLSQRNRATSRASRILTTMSQSAQFHRAMWAVLKSGTLTVDGVDWQQLGDYSITEGTAPHYRGQGRCTLLATRQAETRSLWAGGSASSSANYAQISRLNGAVGLSILVKGYTFEGELREGLLLPAGEYQFRVVTGAEALTLTIDGPDGETTRLLLWPQSDNRLRNVRLQPGSHLLSLQPVSRGLLTAAESELFGDPEQVVIDHEAQTVRLSDFSTDFNNDFNAILTNLSTVTNQLIIIPGEVANYSFTDTSGSGLLSGYTIWAALRTMGDINLAVITEGSGITRTLSETDEPGFVCAFTAEQTTGVMTGTRLVISLQKEGETPIESALTLTVLPSLIPTAHP